ncbi:hypothetical protein OMAG_002152 [Candidatus Omnitrophus magneticus]|uniref:Helix-hairpin-helix DNA-binding motif class 1 domain-containing protein n=1 Tax=Candidatus Omnitrophus magneticus TaxID=1609969 RepID=A0A0F0CRB6_9BACT|nr:hypothetical protein OMAG_002152 [Candidatus Omnitrophus magneticus]
MTLNKYEKLIFLILLAHLLIASLFFYLRVYHPRQELVLVKNSFHENISIAEIKKQLDEKRKVSINKASVEELKNIPYIGETLADEIYSYIQTNGPIIQTDDLLKVKGIGAKKIEKIKNYIKIE